MKSEFRPHIHPDPTGRVFNVFENVKGWF